MGTSAITIPVELTCLWTRGSPDTRAVELPESGNIVVFPCVGELDHRYARIAA